MKTLLVIAALTLATAAHAQPKTVKGVYVVRGACPFEGCTLGQWRATAPVTLYAAPGASKGVGRVAKGAWVRSDRAELWLTPWRGVVRRNVEMLKARDVVWLLDYEGEGVSNLWRRGEIVSWQDAEGGAGPVAWDRPLAQRPVSVWWVHVRASPRLSGWVRDANRFDCRDRFSGDEGCRWGQ